MDVNAADTAVMEFSEDITWWVRTDVNAGMAGHLAISYVECLIRMVIQAARGHLECIKYLVDEGGADVNAADEDGVTDSRYVGFSQGGHLDCIKYLVGEGGADVNAADMVLWSGVSACDMVDSRYVGFSRRTSGLHQVLGG